MSDHHNRVELVVSGGISVNGNQGDGGVLAVLQEFIGQVYPKLDWIIAQNEQLLAAILASSGGNITQEQIDQFTAQVRSSTESLRQQREALQKTIEENKQDAN